ncbi:MAG: DNRLRE domain-containing protein, partial [Acidobacteria bacterium]|nr:DNRLRE domain-containing protein [Acidobacteriota bacterium]
SVAAGANLYVSANATDPEDGDLRSAVQWSSDRDGDLGSGSPRLVTLSSGGRHLITATVSDSNQTKIQTSVLVEPLESDVPRMFVDRPGHLEVVSGVIPIQGWATDASGVEDISFKLDGLAVNVANFTYGTYRLGACDANADLNDPNCPFVGFQGNLDTSPFSNGLHTLSVTARDHFGNAVTFNRRFETQNQATLSFAPTADAWISEAQPNGNFGGDTSLQLRASGSGDARHTYLKFQVSGVLRPVQNATLQLRYASDSFRTIRIYWIKSSKWTESGITWLKAPTDFYLQYPVALPLPLPGNNRFELDVSRIISGDGTYTIGLVAQDLPDQAIFSRETGLAAPNLEVTF